MSAAENKATIQCWVEETWNNGNFASADEMYTANYILHDTSGPITGAGGLKQFITVFRTGFPDLHFTLEDMITEGDRVAWRYTARGMHRDELMGIPPTGRQAIVTGMVCSRFVEGKWAEDWSNFDALGILQQLGVIPAMS